MKIIFAHDHIFYKYKDMMYSTGGLSKEMLERYTDSFDEVTVLSRQYNTLEYNDNLTLASTDNIKFVDIPNFKSIETYNLIKKAREIITQEVLDCDAVIARLPSSIGNLVVEAAVKNNKPYLVEVVACSWDALWNHSIKGKMLAPYNTLKLKNMVKNAPYVIYVTSDFLQRRYPTNGKNTNCSNVALTGFDDKTLEKRLRKIRFMQSNRKIVIGTTAAVDVRYKGQQYVIEALGKLKKEGITNFEYQLVGNGNQTYLKAITEKYDVVDQVKFIGAMPHKKVFDWLETIDIYTQPSKQEGLPRALIEAMSRGLPSFGAKTAGIPELLDSNYIFNQGSNNINEICEILLSFNQDVMTEQAKRNYQESKKYSKEVIEKRRKLFFEEFKNNNSPNVK